MTDTIGIVLTVADKGTVVVKKFSKGTVSAVKRMSERSIGYVKKLQKVFTKGLGGAIKGLGGVIQGLGRRFINLAKTVAKLGLVAVVAAAGWGIAKATQKFAGFEVALNKMGNVAAESLGSIKAKIMALPSALGSATELVKGYYMVISAGATNPVKAMELLVTASKASKESGVEMGEVVKGLAAVMGAYSGELKKASDAADLLYTIEKKGITNIGELIPQIGNLANMSKAVGLSANEMGASLAQVTTTGAGTNISVTYLLSLLTALSKNFRQLPEEVKQYGSSLEAVKALGFGGVLKAIWESTEGNSTALIKMLGRQEAYLALLQLSKKDFGEYGQKLDEMKQKTGAFADAWKRYGSTLTAIWETFKNTIGTQAILIGEKLAPAIKGALTATSDWLQAMRPEITRMFGSAVEYIGESIEKILSPLDEISNRIEIWYWRNEDLIKSKILEWFEKTKEYVLELYESIQKLYKDGKLKQWANDIKDILGLVGKAALTAGKAIVTTLKYWSDYKKNQFKWDDQKNQKVVVEFEGKGSTIKPLSEKIAELQGRFGAFAGYIGGLQPKFTIDATMATAALEGLDSNFQDKLQKMIGYIAGAQVDLYNLNQRKPGSGYSTYKRLFDLQIESGQGQINDLMRRWGTERALTAQMFGMPAKTQTVGGAAVFGDINIYVPESAAPQTPQDWREIARKYILPELEAVGHA